jgi:hypothetical protein
MEPNVLGNILSNVKGNVKTAASEQLDIKDIPR